MPLGADLPCDRNSYSGKPSYMSQALVELMQRYARRGISDWNAERGEAKGKAYIALANKIADKVEDADRTINASLKGAGDERCLFIPMPMINHDKIKYCFFLPIRMPEEGKAAFDLFLFVDGDNCLSFRFEPADLPDRAHGYAHVQMSIKMFRKNFEAKGIPVWLPDSYPAFPLRASDPLEIFLSMATSIHGFGARYTGGIIEILREVCKSPADVDKYIGVLKKMLN